MITDFSLPYWQYGIRVLNSQNTVLINNTISNISQGAGISIGGDYNITIDSNQIHNIIGDGIGGTEGVRSGLFINNVITNVSNHGIHFQENTYQITNNRITKNKINLVSAGIVLIRTNKNFIQYNELNSGGNGISLWGTENSIYNNTFYNNSGRSLGINSGNYNNISNNLFFENQLGIFSGGDSLYNLIFNNYFVNNFISANEGINSFSYWNNSEVGNYWSDFEINPGYPNYYVISGDGDGVDYHPIWDFDGDGWYNYQDCNDNNSEVNPGHPEWCGTNYDDDCDGYINEGCSPHGGSPIFQKIIQMAMIKQDKW